MLYNYINKMMRQSEFKKKYDPDTGKFSRNHIYGEGIMDSVKSFLGKKPTKKKVTFAPPPKPTLTATKKAGDKIVKMLSGKNPPSLKTNNRKMTQQEINNNVLKIMSGSGRKK